MSKKSRSRKKKDRYIKWLKKQATELQARKQSKILCNILSIRIDEIFQSQLISKMPLHLKKLPQAIDTPVVSMNINQLQELDKQELIAIIISYQKTHCNLWVNNESRSELSEIFNRKIGEVDDRFIK